MSDRDAIRTCEYTGLDRLVHCLPFSISVAKRDIHRAVAHIPPVPMERCNRVLSCAQREGVDQRCILCIRAVDTCLSFIRDNHGTAKPFEIIICPCIDMTPHSAC
ncbi:hypothetical protein D3C71_1310850 [compost metagenome]